MNRFILDPMASIDSPSSSAPEAGAGTTPDAGRLPSDDTTAGTETQASTDTMSTPANDSVCQSGFRTTVDAIMANMSLEEKLAQLVGVWINESTTAVAPMQAEMSAATRDFEESASHGLGQFARVYGSRPVEPIERLKWLRDRQTWLQEETTHGIPAIVHEESLTGVLAWQATAFPTPLAWGASFNPDLINQMGAAIGTTMRALGIHQGLAPVLDVVRDARWGRVEECISEDPYLVGCIGAAYISGMQSQGVDATVKHFVGYSASRAGRNLAPTSVGARELRDVLLLPFEIAILDAKAASVMHSYTEIDGIPTAADESLLTGLLRTDWGFQGTVVADYFGIAFLHSLHGVASDIGDAALQALQAGVDIELPRGDAYLGPLASKVRDGAVPEALVDRAVRRALVQKARLGLLDEGFGVDVPPSIDLDPPEHRAIAAKVAEQSIVLLSNSGALPLTEPRKIAVIGPNADRANALLGCYSFSNHVLSHYPGTDLGIDIPTVLDAARTEWPSAHVSFSAGCDVTDQDTSGFAEACENAADADVALVIVGDQAGMFGRGTVGEGCDRDSLELPGAQRALVEAIIETCTPVVLLLLTGRPYALEWAVDRCAAVVQAFFAGEAGAQAIAGVVSGRINPSGRLPVSLPRSAGSQPSSYLHPKLAGPTDVSSLDPTPVRPFGHGLSYTSFVHTNLRVKAGSTCTTRSSPNAVPAGQPFEVSVEVTNSGERAGADVVQLYANDVVASVTRPVAQLVGFHRLHLNPGERATVSFVVPATRLAFTDRSMRRVVEPGLVHLWVGPDCTNRETVEDLDITGPTFVVTPEDERLVESSHSIEVSTQSL